MQSIDGVPVVTYDLEVFPNYFLATFLIGSAVKVFEYHAGALDGLRTLAATFAPAVYLCGYNSFSYDDLILGHVLAHPTVTNTDIYNLSKKIIESRHEDQRIFEMTYARRRWAGSVDMFQILNKKGSLKEWTCRERSPFLVESGHAFDKPLPAKDFAAIRQYCLNDTRVTAQLLHTYWPLIDVRTQLDKAYRLGKAVYTLSEPGLAQRTFLTLHRRRVPQSMQTLRDSAKSHTDNTTLWHPLKSIISPRVAFSTFEAQKLLHALRCTTVQACDPHGVRWRLPNAYDQPITFGKGRYKLGVGGLHSIDRPGRWGESDGVWDVDVTSYYPSLIIEEGYFPAHLGPGFVDDMRAMRDRRVALKKAGDKAGSDALKIVINSAFGKLNDVWSPLRSVPNALRVTINGQLMLLMLIEMMEKSGIEVLSANTDGVTVKAYARHAVENVMTMWTRATKHTLELTRFLRYCRRDVNAYVALKEDGTIKSKGAYEQRPITPGSRWDGIIIKRAVQDYLLHDKPIRATITASTVDQRDFLFYSRVKNGGTVSTPGLHDKAKTARWYVARRGHRIERLNPKGTRAVLPNAHKARLAMDIEHCDMLGLDFLDYEHYISAAEKLAAATMGKA